MSEEEITTNIQLIKDLSDENVSTHLKNCELYSMLKEIVKKQSYIDFCKNIGIARKYVITKEKENGTYTEENF